MKRNIPTAILPSDTKPTLSWDFKPDATVKQRHLVEDAHVLDPFEVDQGDLKPSALRVLRILARLKTAHTPEITSLAGFSDTHVRNLLKVLEADHLIQWQRIGKYDGWAILSKGLRLAHRSWNIPKGAHFARYRTEYRYAGERHRRVSRLWRAWLETAYEDVKIW